ncbi:IS66-like element accessory protein TnpA [Collimonas humicola]|uniref:IS66-like element accessory protein TnpA n=1 Tax=Collimonas humicola TaxID=2825886 RepID=UPI001B8AFAAF|nr:transposase [Collimonas humicola]
MGTNTELSQIAGRRYRSHSLDFKRQVVEESYLPDTSVARVARGNGINANQLFGWRKMFRDQELAVVPPDDTTFLPVEVQTPGVIPPPYASSTTPAVANDRPAGRIDVTVGKARLTVHGSPDTTVLPTVLAELLR